MSSLFDHGLARRDANYEPLTPVDFIARAAQVYGNRLAVVHGAVRRTWAQTYERAQRLAGALAAAGIQRGDTVASLLARLQIDDAQASQILRNNPQARALYQLVPGKVIRANVAADGKLVSLRYLNGGNLVAVDRKGNDLLVKQDAAQLERRVLMKSAEIRNSLFGATDAAGLSDSIATQIADIFSTDID